MRFLGTGSALPERVVTNDELATILDTSDKWITQRTGIRSRHVLTDEHLEDLAALAAGRALEDASLDPGEIDYFICSNVVDDYPTPSLCSLVSERLGLTCPCIDINCACAGFVYALDIAECRYEAGKARNILIVCADAPTRMCDWRDRSTSVLFGDGAGAVVLGPGDNIRAIRLTSKPDMQKLWQRSRQMPTPFYKGEDVDTGLQMAGGEVFRYAVDTCSADVLALLAETGLRKEDISYYLIHQANQRITDAIRRFLDEPEWKFPSNISDHGNSSSASCTILLDECRRSGLFERGDIIVLSAFGAGLLSGTAVVQW